MVLRDNQVEQSLIEPRVRLVILPLLSVAHTGTSTLLLFALVLFTMVICFVFPEALRRGSKIILLTIATLAFFGLLVWVAGYNVPVSELVIGNVRLLSLAIVSLVLILSMNSLEVITGLSYFRLPVGIALAVGVGLRFLPVFAEEAKRVRTRQTRERKIRARQKRKETGLIRRLDKSVSPFVVSVLRRVDLLLLSIAIQQLQERIRLYKQQKLKTSDWIALLTSFGLMIASFSL